MIRKGTILDNVRLNTNVASRAILIANTTNVSFHSVISGAPVGSLRIEISDDTTEDRDQVISWIVYKDSPIAISAAGQYMISVADIPEKWVRIVYIVTSGDGFITTNFHSTAG